MPASAVQLSSKPLGGGAKALIGEPQNPFVQNYQPADHLPNAAVHQSQASAHMKWQPKWIRHKESCHYEYTPLPQMRWSRR